MVRKFRRLKIKGFTLIELLLVIAILGVLIALILPRFEDVRTTANTRVCVANLRGLASAMAVYETAKNLQVSWGTGNRNTVDLRNWQYLAAEPTEPYGKTGSTTYALLTNSGNLPDRARCPLEAAADSDGTGHTWP